MKLVDREDLRLAPPILVSLVAAWLRVPAARRIAAELMARLAYGLSREKRRAIDRSLDGAFGDLLSADMHTSIAFGSLRGVWEELSQIISGPVARRDLEPCQIRGLDHLRETLGRGRGAILWESGALGPRMMPKRLLEEQGFAIHQVHAFDHMAGLEVSDPAGSLLRSKVIGPFFQKCEDYFVSAGQTYVPGEGSLTSLRDLERRLMQNGIIAVAGDGPFGRQTHRLPFLGAQMEFATGMVSLAKRSGAGLLPLFCVRQGEGGYLIEIGDAIPLRDLVDRQKLIHETLSAYAGLLEGYVRRYPDQYRNWHLVASSGHTS